MIAARVLAGALLLPACARQEPARKPGPSFPALRAPSGAPAIAVARDDTTDTPGRVACEVAVAIDPKDRWAKWEGLDRLLPSLYRQVSRRYGFANAAAPQEVDVRVYQDAAKAATEPEAWVGRAHGRAGTEPAFEIRYPFPLTEKVTELVAKKPDFGPTLRPKIDADDEAGRLAITVPYHTGTGEDRYRDAVDFGYAIQVFDAWTLELFDRFPHLRDLTFAGEHRGREVVRIRVYRAQLAEIDIDAVEEGLGAFQGAFMPAMMGGSISDKLVERKMAEQRRKVYREMLARLPAEQVTIASDLR